MKSTTISTAASEAELESILFARPQFTDIKLQMGAGYLWDEYVQSCLFLMMRENQTHTLRDEGDMDAEMANSTPFTYQLTKHITSSFQKIKDLSDKDIQEQIARILTAVQDPKMNVFRNARDFLTYSIKDSLMNHLMKYLKINLLKFTVSKVWDECRVEAGKELNLGVLEYHFVLDAYNRRLENGGIDSYNGMLRNHLSRSAYAEEYKEIMDNYLSTPVRERYPSLQNRYPVAIHELFWIFQGDFSNSQSIAKLTEVITQVQEGSFEFFINQVHLVNLLSDALPDNLRDIYRKILDGKQEIINRNLEVLPDDLKDLEQQHPGLIARFIEALKHAEHVKGILEFRQTENPAFFTLIAQAIKHSKLEVIIQEIGEAKLEYAENSFYCEELQGNFFHAEEMKVASSFIRQILQGNGYSTEGFDHIVFTDPSNIIHLIDFCRGDGLGWLVSRTFVSSWHNSN